MVLRQLPIQIGEKTYPISSDDNYLDYIKSGFEPEMVTLFQVLAKGSHAIIDIGANIGCTSILFSQLSDVVYSYEPSPSTFALLKKNIEASGISNVVLKNCGLGAVSSQTTLTFSPSNRSGGFVSNQINAGAGFVTETIQINQLDQEVKSMAMPVIDLIKIDVEGFEAAGIAWRNRTYLATYTGRSSCWS
jgi:FkbM family methyltransferase